MRTTVIPAQITTVEDKIAGNLNLTQLMLMVASLFIGVMIYALLPKQASFSLYKIPSFVIDFIICFGLALRIKGKIVLNWLIILLSYKLRPSYYVANKNDLYLRDIVLEPIIKKKERSAVSPSKAKQEAQVPIFNPDKIESILGISRAKLSFKFDKEVINAIWQVKK